MTSPSNDIIYEARVDDMTLQFFDRFDRNLTRMQQTAEQGFNRVDNSIGSLAKSGGMLAGVFASLTAKAIEFGLQGLAAIKQFVEGSKNLTARADTLQTTLDLVGQKAGYSRDEIAQFEEEVKAMGITTVAARQSLLRMTRANIDWAEAAKLARIAQDAAVIAGMNSSQAFERIVLGIQKMEPELLDELGITLNRTRAYEDYAKTLGKTAKELSIQEKQQAILNDVYRQSEVVSGSYSAAMGTVGKQAASLDRYIEELQLSIGRLFQPMEMAKIQFMTETLKELQAWFKENEKAIQEVADVAGLMAKELYGFLAMVLDFAAKMPALLEDIGVGLASIVNDIFGIMDDEEFQKSADNWWVTGKKFIVLLAGMFTWLGTLAKGAFQGILAMLEVMGDSVKKFWEFLKRPSKETWEAFNNQDLTADMAAAWTRATNHIELEARDAAQAIFQEWATAFGLIEAKSEDTADEVVADFGSYNDAEQEAAQDMLEKFQEAFSKIQTLINQTGEGFMELAKKGGREKIEADIRLEWRVEDIEKQAKEAVDRINAQFATDEAKLIHDQQDEINEFLNESADRRKELAEDKANALLDVERDYQRELANINQRANDQLEDASGERDAIAIARIRRERRRALRDARVERDQERADTEADYAERERKLQESLDKQKAAIEAAQAAELAALRQSHEDQLKAAEEARIKQYQELNDSLARDKEIKDLHRQWEEEDRQEAFRKQFYETLGQYSDLEGVVGDKIREMLENWQDYYLGLRDVATDINNILLDLENTINGLPNLPPGWSADIDRLRGGTGGTDDRDVHEETGELLPPDYDEWTVTLPGGNRLYTKNFTEDTLERIFRHYYGDNWKQHLPPGWQSIIGQAGQVSQLLTGLGQRLNLAHPLTMEQPSRLPAVAPTSSYDRREIVVKGDVSGMDPHLQRVMVTMLAEIERNRGVARYGVKS